MRFLAVSCALFFAGMGQAHASFFELYGFGARGLAMGSAQLAVTDDFTAVFYNPARLASRSPQQGAGLSIAAPDLSMNFDLAEPKWGELKPSTAELITFGARIPIGPESLPLAVGVGFGIPLSSLLAGRAFDPETPHWVMYEASPHRILAFIGAGVRPVRWLAFGASIQLLAALEGSLDFELDVVAGRFSEKTVRFDIIPRAAPVVGFEMTPTRELTIAFGWRGVIATDVTIPVNLDVTSIASLNISTDFVVQYQPHRLLAGVSYSLEDIGLLVTAEAAFEMWSVAPDPSVDSVLDASGDLLENTGLAGALDAPAPGQERRVKLGFRNVIVPKLGAELEVAEDVLLRGGYSVRPSPAPVQSSGSNYIDGTAHTLSAGFAWSFERLLPTWTQNGQVPLRIEGSAGFSFLPSRRHTKTASNDPVGSFEAGGRVFLFGVALSYGGSSH